MQGGSAAGRTASSIITSGSFSEGNEGVGFNEDLRGISNSAESPRTTETVCCVTMSGVMVSALGGVLFSVSSAVGGGLIAIGAAVTVASCVVLGIQRYRSHGQENPSFYYHNAGANSQRVEAPENPNLILPVHCTSCCAPPAYSELDFIELPPYSDFQPQVPSPEDAHSMPEGSPPSYNEAIILNVTNF